MAMRGAFPDERTMADVTAKMLVEVGAVKTVSLISGGLPVDTDANVTYTVTDLVGNGDGEGEPNQKPGTG